MRRDPLRLLWLFLILFATLTVIFWLASCSSIGGTDWQDYPVASVADYEVNFTYRGDFNNFNDFLRRVKADLAFLKKQGYEIIKIEYEHSRDMTQRTVICFAVIYYKEKK